MQDQWSSGFRILIFFRVHTHACEFQKCGCLFSVVHFAASNQISNCRVTSDSEKSPIKVERTSGISFIISQNGFVQTFIKRSISSKSRLFHVWIVCRGTSEFVSFSIVFLTLSMHQENPISFSRQTNFHINYPFCLQVTTSRYNILLISFNFTNFPQIIRKSKKS